MNKKPANQWPKTRISPSNLEKCEAVRFYAGMRSQTEALNAILGEFFTLSEADVPTFGPLIQKIRDHRKLAPAEIVTDRDLIFSKLARIEAELGIEDELTARCAEDAPRAARKKKR